MLSIIDWILETCGSSLQVALESEHFSSLLEREKQIAAIKSNTDQGVAYRFGHLVMGTLFARMSEKSAIEQARKSNEVAIPSLEERALIHLCGEEIVSSAEKCLTQVVRDLAKLWLTSSADEQLKIVRKLFFEFRTESQNSTGDDLTLEYVHKKLAGDFLHRERDHLAYLPGLYKTWDKVECPANCQGKAQMLLAFAKLAGAESVVVHPIEHASEYTTKKRREVMRKIESDLVSRDLGSSCPMFTEGLVAGRLDEWIRDMNHECFHIGVALRLKDERWVMLDPHGLVWGVIPKEWGLEMAITILNKYRDVLPGLAVVGGDPNTNHVVVDNLVSEAHKILDLSRRMEERIRNEVHSIMDLIVAVSESNDLDFLLALCAKQDGESPPSFSDLENRRYATMMLLFQGDMTVLFDYSRMLDQNFLEKTVKTWLSFYHACAANMFMNSESDRGLLIHPVCEVSASSEWSIAISAINSARFDQSSGCCPEEEESFFVRNSFDQTCLFNAVHLQNEEVGIAARRALQSLPYQHPMCVRKLQIVERRCRNGW